MIKGIQRAVLLGCAITLLAGCPAQPPGTPHEAPVTLVGTSVTTLQQTSTLPGCAGTDPLKLPSPIKEPQSWWDSMPPDNHQYPFAGWHAFQTGVGGCAAVRIDAYRAVVTFNLASVARLKGLVKQATLTVGTRALPAQAGMTLEARPPGAVGTPTVKVFCPAHQGGGGSLARFGQGAAVPMTNGTGNFEMLGSNPFPGGANQVYAMPPVFRTGAVANATHPTTATFRGDGGSEYSTDVTGIITAALNANAAGLSWMLASNFEGPLPGSLTASGEFDCRTSYKFDLEITSF